MSKKGIFRGLAICTALVLSAVPVAMADQPEGKGQPADPGSQGNGHSKAAEHSKAGGKAVVTYVFKGTYAGAGAVEVNHGNNHVRKADLVETTVNFDLSEATLVVGDTDDSGIVDVADLATGDKVVVKARLARKDPDPQPFKATQVVDQTHNSA
jgi:hypothetical protein